MINVNACVDKNFKDLGKFQIFQKNYDNDFDQFNDNSNFLAVKKISQCSALVLGIVVYAEPTFYNSDKEINEDLHLPGINSEVGRDFYRSVFESFFGDLFNKKPKQIVFGHEHGTENGKCHIQICVSFDETFRGTVRPGFFLFSPVNPSSFYDILKDFEGVRFLFMSQKARNPRALSQYCMKDGDFFYLHSDKAIQYVHKKNNKGELTEKIDAFATIYKNKSLIDIDQAKDLVLTHEPRTGITMYKNIEYALTTELSVQLPQLEWKYPHYLLNRYSLIEKWFEKWCKPDDLMRRKALLLYSEKRCLGKTEFALSLVNDPAYVVIFRNSFVDCMKNKTPKLLILDDMTPYNHQNKETWKALVASQPTAIRDAYFNYNWDFRIPCIITTNNLFLVQQLFKSKDFNTQIVFQEITDYMGPPGTEPQDMFDIEQEMSMQTLDRIQKIIADSDEKFLKKKTGSEQDVLTELMKLKQQNLELKEELKKFKKK